MFLIVNVYCAFVGKIK